MLKQKKILMVAIFCFLIMHAKSDAAENVKNHDIGFKDVCQYFNKKIIDNPVISVSCALAIMAYLSSNYWCPAIFEEYLDQEFDSYEYEDEDFQNDQNYQEDDESEQKEPAEQESAFEAFQKCSGKWYVPGDIQLGFEDVAGMHEAKASLYDVVDFLSDPAPFEQMGARIPKGILLAGKPGTGKTLLARAAAKEANVPLCYVSASEFIQGIVGVGAARVRDLFKQARQAAPCIIFIDEIDSIGKKRSAGTLGGDSELTQTLNQLLAEMDGFLVNETPIVIMAATNRIDVLDEALIRPGRFDRQVNVPMPFVKDRMEILRIHLRSVKHAQDINIARLARATSDFSGADLACLVNDAAILAVRQKASCVSMEHFQEAYDTMLLGRVCKETMAMEDKELWATAVHEAGHALLCVYQEHANALYKVSIEPRGRSLGVTWHLPEVERYNDNYEQLFAQMVMSLGGSVAEDMVYGNRGTGVLSDLQKVRNIAIAIIATYGMWDDFRNVTFSNHDWQDLSPDIRDRLELEIHKLIAQAQKVATQILAQHRLELDALVNLLLEKLVVSGDEVYELCGIEKPNIEFSLLK